MEAVGIEAEVYFPEGAWHPQGKPKLLLVVAAVEVSLGSSLRSCESER